MKSEQGYYIGYLHKHQYTYTFQNAYMHTHMDMRALQEKSSQAVTKDDIRARLLYTVST